MPDGKAIDWTDEDLDEMIVVRRSDADEAVRWWRKVSPAWAKSLLDGPPGDAEVKDDA